MGFDPTVHVYESTCAICLQEFEKDDKISQLECHYKHIFHTKCIDNWIKKLHNSCPVCRVPILVKNNQDKSLGKERNEPVNEEHRALLQDGTDEEGICPFVIL